MSTLERLQLYEMKQTPPIDNDLIHNIVQGDENALRQLYAAYGSRMYAYALRLVGDPSTAEDIVQDTLVIIWQQAHRFRGEGRALAWILGIVHNQARRIYRKRSPLSWEELPEDPPAPDFLPEQAYTRQETSQALHTAMLTLSPDHAAVLELVFNQGLSLKETAEVMHCPTGTIKSRLSYARRCLKAAMAKDA